MPRDKNIVPSVMIMEGTLSPAMKNALTPPIAIAQSSASAMATP
jgi:hypothetical protein